VLEESAVRALATRRAVPAVVSFYLDVDGRRYPRPSDYAPRIEHLFRLVRRAAEHHEPHVATVLEADLARIADWLGRDLDRSTTRGVAAFSASAQGFFEVFELSLPVRDQAVVGAGPDVAQLVAILAASQPALLVAVDRQRSRMLRVLFDEVEELEAPIDEIPRQVDTDVELGSFEHRHEEFTRKHLRRVARAVVEELRHHPAEHLVLSGSRETVAQLEAYLPQHTLVLLSGRIDLPTSRRQADLARATNELVQQTHRRRQLGLAKELRDRAIQGAAAVTGLTATLDALSDQRIETLAVDAGFEAQGGRCRDCDALVALGERCSRCGGTVVPVENVVDAAITEAFTHHVGFELCERDDLADLGHIGAFERR